MISMNVVKTVTDNDRNANMVTTTNSTIKRTTRNITTNNDSVIGNIAKLLPRLQLLLLKLPSPALYWKRRSNSFFSDHFIDTQVIGPSMKDCQLVTFIWLWRGRTKLHSQMQKPRVHLTRWEPNWKKICYSFCNRRSWTIQKFYNCSLVPFSIIVQE